MRSMTGFGEQGGEASGRHWRWEIKSVNGRGLDVRYRLADALAMQEASLRAIITRHVTRGSVTVQLWEDASRSEGALKLNAEALESVIRALGVAEHEADGAGVSLAPSRAADILAIKGVMETGGAAAAPDDEVTAAVLSSFEAALQALVANRVAEGGHQRATLTGLINQIEEMTGAAAAAFDHQQDGLAQRLSARLADLSETEVAPDRLAQEVALLVVKGDVREELDRLAAHIVAARDLIATNGPVGRKLDFLTQEFNREVNTLCSKSGSTELTRIGLEMKVIVDQVREQAQNVE